jgi:hypothetical protein
MKNLSIFYLAVCIILGVYAGSQYSKDWKAGYEAMTASQKMDYLWARVTADKTPGPAASIRRVIGTVAPTMLGGVDFAKIGKTVSDEMPDGVYKGIHAVGVVCKGKFAWNAEVTRLGLTGSFSVGNADHVLARLSSAMDPTKLLVPNAAWKILRDGRESGNFFSSHQIENQKTTNWFEFGGCNHVHNLHGNMSMEGVKNMALKKVFGKAGTGNWANLLGVSEVGLYNQKGKPAGKNNTPFVICVQPTQEMHQSRKNVPLEGQNFGGLTNIKAGKTLYHVYAVMEAKVSKDMKQGDVVHIGDFTTTDSCTSSKFGDERLFYKHTYWLDELKFSGKAKAWAHVNDVWTDDDGLEKYEKFFKAEHKITRNRRRLRKQAPVH